MENKKINEAILSKIQYAIDNNYRAVDNGYSDQKITEWVIKDGVPTIKLIQYASRVGVGILQLTFDAKSNSGVYELDGCPYTVSEDLDSPLPNQGKFYSFSDQNTILVNHSLVVSGCSGKPTTLATGLPFSDYFINNKVNESLIDKIKNKVKLPVTSKSSSKVATIEKHLIYPESTAAYIDFAFDIATGNMYIPKVGVVIIDIGGFTTDISYINPSITINKDKSGSEEIGVLTILNELRNLLAQKFDVNPKEFPHELLRKVLLEGTIEFLDETYDVSGLVELSKKVTAKRLTVYIDSIIGDGSFIDKFIVVGGGAYVLGEHLKAERPKVFIPDCPEGANSRGMLISMTFNG